MSIYLCPIADDSDIWIERVNADSYTTAENRLVNTITNRYDLEITSDYQDFLEICYNQGIQIGDIYESDEFAD